MALSFGMPTLIENKDLDESVALCREHMTLGAGEIDLLQRLEIAKRHGCRCVVETKTVEALRESVRWLRENKC